MSDNYSLSSWERVRVRGNSMSNRIDVAVSATDNATHPETEVGLRINLLVPL
jgi:hypothetical protein